jgi:ribosomal protein L12E/L44/L45/RPP1/RPP2
MVVGFNHNFRYKGELFHVQTEDSGLKSPHIITLLYRGGTILASKKTSYADITKVDRLEQVVEELMKEQHREMLRRLKGGEFDEIIAGRRPADAPAAASATVAPAPSPASAPEPKSEIRPEPTPVAGREQRPTVLEGNLDEIILSYLLGDGEEKK